MSKWIAVDLDGTLAEYNGHVGVDHIGAPIPKMVERVKAWLAEGRTVKIFTARVHGHGMWIAAPGVTEAKAQYDDVVRLLDGADHSMPGKVWDELHAEKRAIEEQWVVDAITPIEEWCLKHIGQKLEVTNVKDFGMGELWDDRAIQVVANTGERVGNEPPAGGRPQSIDSQ